MMADIESIRLSIFNLNCDTTVLRCLLLYQKNETHIVVLQP